MFQKYEPETEIAEKPKRDPFSVSGDSVSATPNLAEPSLDMLTRRQEIESRPADQIDGEYAARAFILNPRNLQFMQDRSRGLPPSGGVLIMLMGLFFALIMLPVGVVPMVSGFFRDSNGTVTTATVVDTRFSRGSKGSVTYYIRYSFTAASETGIVVEESVDSGLYYSVSAGTRLQVKYQTDYPSNARLLKNQDNDTLLFVLFGTGFGSVLGGVGLFIWGSRRHLNRHGYFVRGQIVKCSGTSSKNGYNLTARYEFRDASGTRHSGRTIAVRNDLRRKPLPGVGTPAVIVWDGGKRHQML